MNMPEPLRCPECDGATTTHTVDSMQIEMCDRCGGAWFGANQLKKVMADGATAFDELMGFQPKGPHAAAKHTSLCCPHCRIMLHRNQLAHAPDVAVDTCYGCGGLYVGSAALAKLDDAAHHPAPEASQPANPAVQQAGKAIDAMVRDDQRRVQAMAGLMASRFGANPYFRIAGI